MSDRKPPVGAASHHDWMEEETKRRSEEAIAKRARDQRRHLLARMAGNIASGAWTEIRAGANEHVADCAVTVAEEILKKLEEKYP